MRCWPRGAARSVILLAAGCAATGPKASPSVPEALRSVPEEWAATPQRPTLSSDAFTAPEGTLEVEAGLAAGEDEGASAPVTLRLGIDPVSELSLATVPWQRGSGGDPEGPGDLVLGLRRRTHSATEDAPAAAFLATLKLPTADADRGLGTGELDGGLATILTRPFEGGSLTTYYALDLLGDPTGGTDLSHSLALAVGRTLAGRIGAFGELAGVMVPDEDATRSFTTLGLTYTPRPSLVLDLSVVVGLDRDVPDLQVQVGFTRNFGQVLGRRF